MKRMLFAVALLLCTTASAEERCQPERNAYRRAVDAYEQAKQALADYDSSSLAPLVPGQADQERQKLQDAVDAARDKVMKASELENDCFRKKACKKRKPGWSCTIAYTYDKCCLDEQEKSKGKGKGP